MKQPDLHSKFIGLIKAHEKLIFKVCYLYADNELARQDLYQEVIVQVWKGYSNFRGDSKFSTWLYQVAINTAIAGFRRDKSSPVVFTDRALPDIADVNSSIVDDEQLELLHTAINQLNEIEKAIVMLYLDGSSYDEMQAVMGISNGVLRVKMTRIKEKLRVMTKKQ